jgi:hypothetical protein
MMSTSIATCCQNCSESNDASLGAGYTYAISCSICCKSQMRYAASAIYCPTRNCYRLHKACRIRLRFAVRYCVAICCAIWRVISRSSSATAKEPQTPNRINTKSQAKSQMPFGFVDAIWCRRCDLVSHMRFGVRFAARAKDRT